MTEEANVVDAKRRGPLAGGSASFRSPRPCPSRWTGLVRDGEAWVALGVVGLGLFFLVGSLNIRVQPSYATIGPRFFPTTVGLGLIACGLWNLATCVLGGGRTVGHRAETRAPAISEEVEATWLAPSEGAASVGRGLGSERPSGEVPPQPVTRGEAADVGLPPNESTALQWVPFLMVAGALVAYVVLLPRAGFVLASALLFAVTAYALGSRRVVRNAVVGLAFAAVVYLAFTRGLGLYLPESFLEHWLG